jgi:hypothetical protein
MYITWETLYQTDLQVILRHVLLFIAADDAAVLNTMFVLIWISEAN